MTDERSPRLPIGEAAPSAAPTEASPSTGIARDQARRLRMIRVSFTNYLTATVLLSMYAAAGTVGWTVPLAYLGTTALGNLGFAMAVRYGFNLRFREPNLFTGQMLFAGVVAFGFLAFVPGLAFLFLSSIFVTGAFGLVQFNARVFLISVSIAGLAIALVLAAVWQRLTLPASTAAEVFILWVTVVCMLMRFGAVASHVGLLRGKLHEKNVLLKQSLARIEELAAGLEHRVTERTAELSAANAALRSEIAERQRTEADLRRAQDELVRAGRLALLGEMSVAITHELNQPLTALRAISDNCQTLIERGQVQDLAPKLQAIARLTERMGRITAQLKLSAGRAELPFAPVQLLASVASSLALLEQRIAVQGVMLEVAVPPDLLVRCDGYRLEQVLVNLFANALDAMRTTALKRLSVTAAPGAGRVVVRVFDTGTGLPPDVLERMFEPFFTTKRHGEGLGLGLVISSRIVAEFGGQLRAANTADGASFEFDLETGAAQAAAA
jgi:signal transduction histidine kinase